MLTTAQCTLLLDNNPLRIVHYPQRGALPLLGPLTSPRWYTPVQTFDSQIIHWPSIAAFDAYLQGVPRPSWVKGICHHNTYKPNDLTWQGRASMVSMMEYYRDTKGWSSGPHLYLAADAPHATDHGIWQLTPMTHLGTHAGPCNATMLGVENVGDFQDRSPTADQYTLLITVTLLILRHWGMPPESVIVHRDCMPGRTCPGKYLTSAQIRADLNKPAPRPTPTPVARYQLVSPCIPLTARSPSAPLATGVVFAAGDVVNVGAEGTQDGWLWVSDRPTTAPGIGWIPSSYARKL